MEVSLEGAPVKSAEASRRRINASAEIKHDEAVRQGAHLEGDFPVIILAEIPHPHSFEHDFRHRVDGGRASRLEIPRVAARARTLFQEHELVESRVAEGMSQVDV